MNVSSRTARWRKISSIILLTGEKREKKGAAKFLCLNKTSRALRGCSQDFPAASQERRTIGQTALHPPRP